MTHSSAAFVSALAFIALGIIVTKLGGTPATPATVSTAALPPVIDAPAKVLAPRFKTIETTKEEIVTPARIERRFVPPTYETIFVRVEKPRLSQQFLTSIDPTGLTNVLNAIVPPLVTYEPRQIMSQLGHTDVRTIPAKIRRVTKTEIIAIDRATSVASR